LIAFLRVVIINMPKKIVETASGINSPNETDFRTLPSPVT